MVQSMLADRFNLKVHHETKELSVYALVIAKNGPKLTSTKLPPLPPGVPSQSELPPPPTPSRGVAPLTAPSGLPSMLVGRGRITATAVPMSQLTEALARNSELANRPIVNQTGLTGSYDFTLLWTPQGTAPAFGGPGDGNQNPANAVPDSSAPSLFTALEEQLGLKLESTKAPADVVVIDHIEEPSPN